MSGSTSVDVLERRRRLTSLALSLVSSKAEVVAALAKKLAATKAAIKRDLDALIAAADAPEPPPVAPAPPAPEEALGQLSTADREALEALVSGDRGVLIDLAARVDLALLRRLAVMGRTRREIAEAERRELDNKARRGEFVAIEDVKRFWSSQVSLVKERLSALPGKLAARLEGLDYDGRYALLDEEQHGILAQLARDVPE